MTKQEIQALIDSKIAGQGTAVDLGGALPTILHEILEAAFAGENVQSNWNENDSQSPQFIQNKPTIPAPYTLPAANAETLGGVKVGSGLGITPDGVLSSTSSPLVVRINFNSGAHIATIAETGITKKDIWDALVAGRSVVGIFAALGDPSIVKHSLCTGDFLGDADGGSATFFLIGSDGAVQYAKLAGLKE